VAESTVRWFIVREKHCWMAADSAEPAKQTGCRTLEEQDGLKCSMNVQSANIYSVSASQIAAW
jgi:hypothetical protein